MEIEILKKGIKIIIWVRSYYYPLFIFIIIIIDMEQHLLSYYLGIVLVIINSIVLLFVTLDNTMVKFVGVINFIGFMMIAYYFMNKEKMM